MKTKNYLSNDPKPPIYSKISTKFSRGIYLTNHLNEVNKVHEVLTFHNCCDKFKEDLVEYFDDNET